jgi:hypothetical protein
MQQFIQMATTMLGTSEQVTRTVTGSLLDIIAKNAKPADASALFDRLPGANELLNRFRAAPPAPPTPPAADPGILGSLSNAASSVLGAGATVLGGGSNVMSGGAAGLSALATLFTEKGLDVTKVPQLVSTFAQWAAPQAGAEVVNRALGSIPGVSTILGTLGALGVPGMPRG